MILRTETNLAAFNATFSRYLGATSKLPDEVLDAKGRDLGIRIYRGFAAHKYGGAGKRRAGLARADLAKRTASGVGTRVRGSLLREYFAKRAEVRAAARGVRGIKQRVKLWQSFVGREVAIRQRGIGVLAASFLWFRSRSSQARGTYYVKNRTGRPLGYVERGAGSLRIVGLTEGLAATDARYGIVSRALSDATADMLVYINRKQAELIRAAERFAS